LLSHAHDAADVIEVPVSQPDRVEHRPRGGDQLDQRLRLGAGIDQHRMVRRLVNGEIRILLERADGPPLHFHAV
jgi:hypothetical protein